MNAPAFFSLAQDPETAVRAARELASSGNAVVLALLVLLFGWVVWTLDRRRQAEHEETRAELRAAQKAHIAHLESTSGKLLHVVEENTGVMKELSRMIGSVGNLKQLFERR